jgi:hypothetical protein
VITRPGSAATSKLELADEKNVEDSTSPDVIQQAAILDSVLNLLATAGTNPGGDNFTIATEQLNQYFNRNATGTDFNLSQSAMAYLIEIGFPETAIKGLQDPLFSIRDARHIEDCMMYYGLANRVAGNGDDLTRLTRLFQWVSRHIMLVPPGSLAPTGKTQQAQSRPYDCLLRGMATEANPAWAERTWIFMALARQIGIDVGILVSSKATDQWLSVALVDNKPYLFDCRIGKAILVPDGSRVATLDEAVANPQILANMQIPGVVSYGPRHSDLATGEMTVLVDLATGYLSPRMRLLEKRLAGKNRMILHRDVAEIRNRFMEVMKPRIKDVRIWDLPIDVEALLFTNPEFVQAAQFTLQIFDFKLPLLDARSAQLRGETTEAIQKFVNMRFAENALLRDRVTPIPPDVQKIIDFYSTYFLALCYLDQSISRNDREADLKNGDLRQAQFFFNETLRLLPEARPERPFFYMFRWGATTNLGEIYQEKGDLESAIRYLSVSFPTGQNYGNLLTATQDAWDKPFSAIPEPLPPAPEDQFAPAQGMTPPNSAIAVPPTSPNQIPNQPLPGLGGMPLKPSQSGIGAGLPGGGVIRPANPSGTNSLIPQGIGNKP